METSRPATANDVGGTEKSRNFVLFFVYKCICMHNKEKCLQIYTCSRIFRAHRCTVFLCIFFLHNLGLSVIQSYLEYWHMLRLSIIINAVNVLYC